MKKLLLLSLIVISSGFLITACQQTTASSSKNGDEPDFVSNDYLTMAVLYQQQAAEYRALCYQAFNLAKIRVDESTKMLGGMKKKAVVVDIDETVLDNSPYEAKCILDGISYPVAWDDWMNASNAKAVPGALEFLKYVKSQGMEVYYISNRKEKYMEQTLKNLNELGFPFADNSHVLLRTETSNKTPRREKVMEKANIILLMGDNLGDFIDIFDSKSTEERFELTNKMKDSFGNQFIVLPNAMYGAWESAFYKYNHSLSPAEKSTLRRKNLKGF